MVPILDADLIARSPTLAAFVAARGFVGQPLPDLGHGARLQALAVRAHAILGGALGKAPQLLGHCWGRAYGSPPHRAFFGPRIDEAQLTALSALMRGARLDAGDPTFTTLVRDSLDHGVPVLINYPKRALLLVGIGEALDIQSGAVEPCDLSDASIDVVNVVDSFDFLT
jgi:hypothetical protein